MWDKQSSLIPNFLPLTSLNHRSDVVRTIFSSIYVLLVMLTTYCLFPTAAGNTETCTERAESPLCCLMLASQPGHSLVRMFVPPKPGAPVRVEYRPSKKGEKKAVRSSAKWGSANKQWAWMDSQTLIPLNGKQIALKGTSATLVSSTKQWGFQLFVDKQNLQRTTGVTATIFSPLCLPDGSKPPAQAPSTSLGTPQGFSLG